MTEALKHDEKMKENSKLKKYVKRTTAFFRKSLASVKSGGELGSASDDDYDSEEETKITERLSPVVRRKIIFP